MAVDVFQMSHLGLAAKRPVFAPFARLEYASEVVPGPCRVRPWMLGFRRDFGYSSFTEPEDMITLVEMIFNDGFLDCDLGK